MSDTPRTDKCTYPADCLGKTLVVNADLAKSLERENAELKSQLRWIDKNLDRRSFVQLFGEEQDVGSLRKMVAMMLKKEVQP